MKSTSAPSIPPLRCTLLLVITLVIPLGASAQDPQDPYLGEIRMFAGNFAPRGWAFCNGQLLDISQNDALFSLLGTTYGGDGRTTFALPDLRGRFAIHSGGSAGPGLTHRVLGAKAGVERVALTENHLPAHNHTASVQIRATTEAGNQTSPAGHVLASDPREKQYSDGETTTNLAVSGVSVGDTGSNQAHENMPPFQAVHFIIALQGVYPSRN